MDFEKPKVTPRLLRDREKSNNKEVSIKVDPKVAPQSPGWIATKLQTLSREFPEFMKR